MTYQKLPRVIRDYPVGFRTINDAQNDVLHFYDAFDAQHVAEPTYRWARGRHDLHYIPRGVAYVYPVMDTTSLYGATATGATYGAHTPEVFVGIPKRVATGIYWIATTNLNGAAFGRVQASDYNASYLRFANCRFSTNGADQGFAVSLGQLTLSGGTYFDAADYAFSITVFSST